MQPNTSPLVADKVLNVSKAIQAILLLQLGKLFHAHLLIVWPKRIVTYRFQFLQMELQYCRLSDFVIMVDVAMVIKIISYFILLP